MILKRLIGVIFVVSFFLPSAVFGATSKVLNKTETPPAIEKGWNLVSSPCDISLSDFKQKNGFSDLEAYSWDGAQYQSADTFERGKGYMINSDAVLNPSAVCDEAHPSDPISINLKQGWNLIGNPFHSAAKASDILGDSASVVSAIYQLSGQKFAEMEIDDNLKPWRGYWIYADEDATISTYDTCALEVRAYKTESSTNALTGDPIKTTLTGTLYLAAIYSCPAANNTITDLWDVTASASWTVSAPSVGTVSEEGVFTPDTKGDTAVTATYNGLEASINIYVVSSEINCSNMILSINPTSSVDSDTMGFYYYYDYHYSDKLNYYSCGNDYLSGWSSYYVFSIPTGQDFSFDAYCANSTGQYSYSSNNLTKITDLVDWKVDDTEIVEYKEGNTFTALSEGTATITATYNNTKSASLKVGSKNVTRTLSSLYITTKSGTGFAYLGYGLCGSQYGCMGVISGETTQLKATGYYYSNLSFYACESSSSYYYSDLSDVTWSVSDESVATIDSDGNLTTIEPGYVTVTAEKDGRSTSISLRVIEDGEVLALTISPSNSVKLAPGEETPVTVYAYTYDQSGTCDPYYYDYYSYYDYDYYYDYYIDDYSSYYSCFQKKDVTGSITKWNYTNESVGSVSGGKFKASSTTGTTKITAEYKGMQSNSLSITVREAAWMVITVYGESNKQVTCSGFACYAAKVGEKSTFIVYGKDEASYWVDDTILTGKATWEVSDTSVATMNGGTLTPLKRGLIWIRATVGDARSDKVWVSVLDNKASEFIIISLADSYYSYKPVKPLKVGDKYYFTAKKYSYTPGTCTYSTNCAYNIKSSDITSNATWKLSDTSVATLEAISSNYSYDYYYSYYGYKPVTGKSQGFVDVSATYDGMTSNSITLDVWDNQKLAYCDSSNINTGDWSDEHTQAILETDCKHYKSGEKVNIRYTAQVENSMAWYLDNCLDLYILDEDGDIVKTIREQGCSTEKLKSTAKANYTDVYQYLATWDMKNDSGKTVPAGKYYATARFYILWEPVIRLPFTITN